MTNRSPNPFQLASAGHLDAVLDYLPDPGWIAQPVWPGDAYGPLAAESKVGKTWAALDLGISVASGGSWMTAFDCTPGRVAYFLGEGGMRNTLRRNRAICASKGIEPEDLTESMFLNFRVPHLAEANQMVRYTAAVQEVDPTLIILDPLYIAAGGANGASLYDMGTHLEAAQHAAEAVGAALVTVHHYNQTGKGKGAGRMSGAGPQEWGRVLATADVDGKRRTLPGDISEVDMLWSFSGGEINDTQVRVRRRVWVEDRNDLLSPMHYEVELLQPDDNEVHLTDVQVAVLAVLDDGFMPRSEIEDRVNAERRERGADPFASRSIQEALKVLLEECGLVERSGKQHSGYSWRRSATDS